MSDATPTDGMIDARILLHCIRALRQGDFSARMPLDLTGAAGEVAMAFNDVAEYCEESTREMERVAREVGQEGRILERVNLIGATGGWKRRFEFINSLISDLVWPTSEIARVIGAVAHGDLGERMRLEWEGRSLQGEFPRLGATVNRMVEQLGDFASEVTRVAREVGTEGKLGGQAQVHGAKGIWEDLTDSVNNMATNLTDQVRNISEVTTAVASGDLSRKITVKAQGEILELKSTINTMVDQLGAFAAEVTRVAKEVGTEGKLGGQAVVPGAAGTWKDLTEQVNGMAANLTDQVRNIADVTTAVARGDLNRRITVDARGEILELKETVNTMVDQLGSFASEVTRVAREVGDEGKLGGQATVEGVGGIWKDLTDSVNFMAGNLTAQVRNIAQVTTAVANGDLASKITVDAKGEIYELKNTINVMVDQLNGFASEVTRVAREVGTEGKLGGQAVVPGVAGIWKDLTDSVNGMGENLTTQVRNIAQVTTAVARGDLTQKITVTVEGEILELKNTINTMVDQLSAFAAEVTRVAREVGTEGKLGGQARVEGVGGTWKDLTDNVNAMAANLTSQVRNIAQVTTAVASGDLTQKISVDVQGEMLSLKDTINLMVDQLGGFAAEVTRVAKEVGTEGKLGGQADVPGVAGIWKDLTDNVNGMAANLTAQVRNIADVTTAVARGDLSRKITAAAQGEILELKQTINIMVDQLGAFAAEVTRVAKEVGTEGNLGGQAQVEGVAGIWKDLTDNVNSMAANLTDQVRNIAQVTTAVARGDLTQKITVDVRGEILELKDTINVMVDQLNSFAAEVTRVAREVGSDGELGGQATVPGVAGTWKDLTDNVNGMAANLTSQVRNIAEVTTAVARGELNRKITVDASGEILRLKDTINTMVDQLSSFASEVTRVAKEVGTDGKLGGQAEVEGVAGIWKDLTENVNFMAANLTSQMRNIADVTISVARGDLSQKITVDVRGEFLQLKEAMNTMVDQLRSFASEVTRVAREVGTDGKLGGQAVVPGVAGTWKDLTDSVNGMCTNLTAQVRNIAQVTTSVAKGDLTQKITVDVKGEIFELKRTINTMVDQLNSFAAEVTRVAREVGTDGKLGGQAHVEGVAGTWKDLTDSVNGMASNLTDQVRGIAKVVTAVANGNLKQKLAVFAKGEIATLADTINGMIDTLATFADQVTDVAREVGKQGKLGGQADVPGAAGTWKDLTDNVNELAANLTRQVRAIAEVATAVTQGDLSRSVRVEAEGEVADLKDNINRMIGNLRDTTSKSKEQDWLKTNLARFGRIMQGQRDIMAVTKMILDEVVPLVSAQCGVFYLMEKEDEQPVLKMVSSYAYTQRRGLSQRFEMGEGLVGQCALEKSRIAISEVPEDYVRITSGLGNGQPRNIVVIPIVFEEQVRAVIELASFNRFTDIHFSFLDQLTESIGIVLNTLQVGSRTVELLKQSQSLTEELQSQQEELKKTNVRLENQATTLKQSEEMLKRQQEELQTTNQQLEEKAHQLSQQKREVEVKNHQIELSRRALQDKAEQLAITSKYKSEFLANMSHELRTPLNSLLILARTLADNPDGNLSSKQLEYANTIHASGHDLLNLINEILDMSKIASGTVTLEQTEVRFADITQHLEVMFRPVAASRSLEMAMELSPELPASLYTDGKRLEQVLKNLLSNAFKFTERGQVTLTIAPARSGWDIENHTLNAAQQVIAFRVRDTGIGIPPENCKLVFEPFQQADSGTARKYGGTGLGLSISREITRLLGGEIRIESSQVGVGSVFVVFLPVPPPAPAGRAAYKVPKIPAAPGDRPAAIASSTAFHWPAEDAPPPADDRAAIVPGDRVLLVVEDDPKFAGILQDMARLRHFKVLLAPTGREALTLAKQYRPDAVTLDIKLPDISGWTVLDQIRNDPDLADIPIQVMSALDPPADRQFGTLEYLHKPASRETLENAFSTIEEMLTHGVQEVLLIEDNDLEREALGNLVAQRGVQVTSVATGGKGLAELRSRSFDCVILDLLLPDMQGEEVLRQMRAEPSISRVPVLVYTAKQLTEEETQNLNRLSGAVIRKQTGSPDRLLAQLGLFLHRVERGLPNEKQIAVRRGMDSNIRLEGRKVLVVDDDARNVLALTAILEGQKMQVLSAENGRDALRRLEDTPDIDVVLMDIMMPEMDGYECTREIRAQERFQKLPVIALTAKAMKGDREKCLAAGASDYIAKPVPPEQLVSLLRVWLYRD